MTHDIDAMTETPERQEAGKPDAVRFLAAAQGIVASMRADAPPGPVFKALNEVIGVLEELRRAAAVRPSEAEDERVLEAAESNADRARWCVHVLGPDDVFAVKSHANAVKQAEEMNRGVFAHLGDTDILCFACAAPWPHGPESHAAALAQMESNDG